MSQTAIDWSVYAGFAGLFGVMGQSAIRLRRARLALYYRARALGVLPPKASARLAPMLRLARSGTPTNGEGLDPLKHALRSEYRRAAAVGVGFVVWIMLVIFCVPSP